MLDSVPSNSAFDGWFLVLELLGFALPVALAYSTRRLPAKALWPTWAAAALLVVVVPVLWFVLLPPLKGLDEAGRWIFVVPMSAANVAALAFAAVRIRR